MRTGVQNLIGDFKFPTSDLLRFSVQNVGRRREANLWFDCFLSVPGRQSGSSLLLPPGEDRWCRLCRSEEVSCIDCRKNSEGVFSKGLDASYRIHHHFYQGSTRPIICRTVLAFWTVQSPNQGQSLKIDKFYY